MTCELKDCRYWRAEDQGCHGEAWWPMYGYIAKLGYEVNTLAHRCSNYRPQGFEGDWYWPIPEEHEGGGYVKGIPEAVKMWLDAGLPEDFRLPGQ